MKYVSYVCYVLCGEQRFDMSHDLCDSRVSRVAPVSDARAMPYATKKLTT